MVHRNRRPRIRHRNQVLRLEYRKRHQIQKEMTMTRDDPLAKPKDAYESLIAQISSPDSPVGIDAKYTHALIIDYLRQITARLDDIEKRLSSQ